MADNVVDVKFGAQTTGFTTGVAEVKAASKSLVSELNEGFSHISEAIRAPLDALAMMKSSLRETAEIAGLTFAVDKIKEAIESMQELGERTVNVAAAIGTTPHEFSLLSGAMQLARGSAEGMDKVLLHLDRSMQEALVTKSSQAAKAAQSLGLTHEQLKRASTDLSYAIDLLADKFERFAADPTKAADFFALTGRRVEDLVPLLKDGSSGVEELKKRADDLGIVLTDRMAYGLEESAKKTHELGAAIEGAGIKAFMAFKPVIDAVIDSLKSYAEWLGESYSRGQALFSQAAQIPETIQKRIDALKGSTVIDPNTGMVIFAPPDPKLARQMAQKPAGAPDVTLPDVTVKPEPKPHVAPWPQEGRAKKTPSTEAHDYEAETRRLIEALETQQRVEDIGYRSQIAHIQALVREKKITADQGLAQEKAVVAQQLASDKTYLQKKEAIYQAEADHEKKTSNAGLQGVQHVHDQELILAADASAKLSEYADKAAEAQAQAAEKAAKAAEEAAKKWQDSWKQVGDQVADALADVLDRTETFAKAMRKLLDSLLKDLFKQLFNSLLFGGGGTGGLGSLLFGTGGGAGGAGGASSGQGLLGSLLGKGLGLGEQGLLGAAIGNPFGAAGSSGLLGGLLGNPFGAASTGLIGGSLGGVGAFFSSLLPAAPFLGGLQHGGIIPSAAGGWTVPSFASGGVLSMLHSNEMVLPSHISQFVQDAAARGGGGHTFNLNISAMDGASVMRQGPALVASINRAQRHGSGVGYNNH